jgi:hypothetical protein
MLWHSQHHRIDIFRCSVSVRETLIAAFIFVAVFSAMLAYLETVDSHVVTDRISNAAKLLAAAGPFSCTYFRLLAPRLGQERFNHRGRAWPSFAACVSVCLSVCVCVRLLACSLWWWLVVGCLPVCPPGLAVLAGLPARLPVCPSARLPQDVSTCPCGCLPAFGGWSACFQASSICLQAGYAAVCFVPCPLFCTKTNGPAARELPQN